MKQSKYVIVRHPKNSAAYTKKAPTEPNFSRPRLEVKTLDRPIWLSFEEKEKN